jgi:hypothetical protein
VRDSFAHGFSFGLHPALPFSSHFGIQIDLGVDVRVPDWSHFGSFTTSNQELSENTVEELPVLLFGCDPPLSFHPILLRTPYRLLCSPCGQSQIRYFERRLPGSRIGESLLRQRKRSEVGRFRSSLAPFARAIGSRC